MHVLTCIIQLYIIHIYNMCPTVITKITNNYQTTNVTRTHPTYFVNIIGHLKFIYNISYILCIVINKDVLS